VRSLERTAFKNGYDAQLLRSVESVNEQQKRLLFRKIWQHFNGNLDGRVFALWGLSFKPNTNDMRDAPSRTLMEALWDAGATVQAFDPEARNEAGRHYPEQVESGQLVLCEHDDDALQGADALVIVTEWRAFRSPDFEMLKTALKQPVIFDGRNIYDPDRMAKEGFIHYGIGLGAVSAATSLPPAVGVSVV
jgi:UDPglucose 6-dehydrogenase